MTKGKLKGDKLYKVRGTPPEDHQKIKTKSHGQGNEEENKIKRKENESHTVAKSPDKQPLIKKGKKRREDVEKNVVEVTDSSEVRRKDQKNSVEIRRSLERKLQGAIDEFQGLYKDDNSENSGVSGPKKKIKDLKEDHSEMQSNYKHDKKVKKLKVENGDKRKKTRQAEKGSGEDEMASDKSSVDNNKKKRKRKAEPESILETGNNEKADIEMLDLDHGKDTNISKKKKKKKNKVEHEPEQESNPALHPALDYLRTWDTNRKNWNFKKVRQVWLLQNMFDQVQIADEDFSILLKYLEGLKGAAKEKTIEMAELKLESETDELDSVAESRVRQVLQLLTE